MIAYRSYYRSEFGDPNLGTQCSSRGWGISFHFVKSKVNASEIEHGTSYCHVTFDITWCILVSIFRLVGSLSCAIFINF